MRTANAISAYRCLKIIINYRIIIRVARKSVFLHQSVIRICTATEHIISEPVCTACKLCKTNTIAVFFGYIGSAVLCDLITRTDFAKGIRNIIINIFIHNCISVQVCTDFVLGFCRCYCKTIVWFECLFPHSPRCIWIPTHHRQKVIIRLAGRPCSHCKKRHFKADFFCNTPERSYMLG